MKLLLLFWSASAAIAQQTLASSNSSLLGRCSMYDSCGSKSTFSAPLPCPVDIPAVKQTDQHYLDTLAKICGSSFSTTTCCSQSQLDVLISSLAQAEPLIATCPACKSNFQHFFCSFTCSPDQASFLTVTETQEVTKGGKKVEAVKMVDVNIAEGFGKGFFDSCKDIKFGATNSVAMDLLGGGAKSYLEFLRYMGQERSIGSPFQINFPASPPSSAFSSFGDQIPLPRPPSNNSGIIPFNDIPISCSSFDLTERCSCPDCPAVCASLLPIQSPAEIEASACRVGKMSCFSFAIVIIYAVLLVVSIILFVIQESIKRKKKGGSSLWTRLQSGLRSKSVTGYDRVPMEDPSAGDGGIESPSSAPSMGRNRSGSGLVGATSTSNAYDGESRERRSGTSISTSNLSPTDLNETAFLQPKTYALNAILSTFFFKIGIYCAAHAYLTLAIGLAICGVLNLGWNQFEVERDPVKLWVAKGSESEIAKSAFDSSFGPFYRTEQIFVSVAPPSSILSTAQITTTSNGWEAVDEPVLDWNVLKWWAGVEEDIRNLQSYPNNYTLNSVCFSPSTDPAPPEDSSLCVVQSIMGYFSDTLDGVDQDTWRETLNFCATSPVNCLPGSQLPLNPKLLFGGIPTSSSSLAVSGQEADDGLVLADQARALIITYVVSNSLDPKKVQRAEEWEWSLQHYLEALAGSEQLSELGLELAWSTGISLEQELNESSNTDVPIVIASYLVMFAYISMNLGSSGAGLMKTVGRGLIILAKAFSQLIQMLPLVPGRGRSGSISLNSAIGAHFQRQLFVESKFLLGLWGIMIVLLSISTSISICSALGIKVTLIIAEVIPFLVLAIGVDNVFILSHELDRQNSRARSTASRRGPLFIGRENELEEEVDSPEERVARALARMGPSILLSTCCESVTFALGAMVGMPAVQNFAIYAATAVIINSLLQCTIFISLMYLDLRRVESNRVDCMPFIKLSSSVDPSSTSEGYIARFIRTTYAPALLKKPVKYFVLALFSGLFVLSWIGARHIELGLDQRLALPADSYLINYFNALDAFLEVGPPVYFVEQGAKIEERSVQQAVCGRFSTCEPLSLANVLEQERKRPESSFLAETPAIWFDDFGQWLNPLLEDCCRVKKSNPEIFCTPEDSEYSCKPCLEEGEWNVTMSGFPENKKFMKYLEVWLESPTDAACPLGGKASYGSALSIKNGKVESSHFRTYQTPLKSQSDFINALAAAQRIAEGLSTRLGVKVFPYSIYAVFFDQYSHIVSTTREVLSLALLSVFLITALFLGSWRTAFVTASVVGSSVVMVMGIMGVAGINLNALSLVNLVISVGISVEFCSHIARAFTGAASGGVPYSHPLGPKDRNDRAFIALVDVGASVFSGITLTKLIGISVLALTKSKLLEVYFFRQWAALILAGFLHGLILLPVALSFFGGQGSVLESEDFISDLTSRYNGLVHDDDSLLDSDSEDEISRF